MVDPTKIEPGDRIVFGYDNRWTAVHRESCQCECGENHSGWVMRYRRQEYQVWWDGGSIWGNSVLLKDWPRRKQELDLFYEHELNTLQVEEKEQ